MKVSNSRLSHTLLAALVLVSAGCGYLRAGTRDDDPASWKGAFRSTKPPDVIVVHSRYWRSPHWTYEFQYFFEIAPNATFKERLFAQNKLRRITGDEAANAKGNVFGAAPDWFAPKAVTEYEVWVFADERVRTFKILIDRNSGHVFINEYLV